MIIRPKLLCIASPLEGAHLSRRNSFHAKIVRWIGGAAAVLSLWFAALIALTAVAEPTRAVIVFAPDRATMISAVTAADVELLEGSARVLNVAGNSPGFVTKLYANGAWLVLPARTRGCITPPPRAAAQSQGRG